jgi:hypothetical protein
MIREFEVSEKLEAVSKTSYSEHLCSTSDFVVNVWFTSTLVFCYIHNHKT